MYKGELVKTSYSEDDVKILLKDLSGKMVAMSTEDREQAIQSGTHYSEMLPLEYEPTPEYMKIYNEGLRTMASMTAKSTIILGELLIQKHGGPFVIVSLARAGIPIGILLKRYIKLAYNYDLPHYSISIIRGKGIDINAMNYIYDNEVGNGNFKIRQLQFLDGWTGKGAINTQLKEAVEQLKNLNTQWMNLSADLAVLADPAGICKYCGTHEDFLIPSACLNSTVSGLVSRTILRDDLIDTKNGDFHGAVYFDKLKDCDKSYEFINAIMREVENLANIDEEVDINKNISKGNGMEVVRAISNEYHIPDINKIKPGVGETTRVLLRRIPWKVLIDKNYESSVDLRHIIRLCKEKNVPYEYREMGNYRACGIIKDLSADA